MSKQSGLIGSSIGRKTLSALTGLFLCLFLIGHLFGNLQLFIPGEKGVQAFNDYTFFMTHNPIIKILSYLTYISIILHAIDGLIITIRNRKARPVRYKKTQAKSLWSSRNMGILGTILLIFIAVHMYNFWFRVHWGPIPLHMSVSKGEEIKDLHLVVNQFFNPQISGSVAYVGAAFYFIAMIALAYHLIHGFQSAFHTLGIAHPKIKGIIKFVGYAFAAIIPAAFASIPIFLILKHIL